MADREINIGGHKLTIFGEVIRLSKGGSGSTPITSTTKCTDNGTFYFPTMGGNQSLPEGKYVIFGNMYLTPAHWMRVASIDNDGSSAIIKVDYLNPNGYVDDSWTTPVIFYDEVPAGVTRKYYPAVFRNGSTSSLTLTYSNWSLFAIRIA